MSENKTYPISPMSKGPRRARLPWARAQRWLAAGENAAEPPQLPVFVTQSVFETINKHAASDLDNEVGGWLAGRWCKDVDTQVEFVVIEALLPAQQVRSGSTFLTFTHDSQVAMLSALEERYAKKGVVGWYHTHPRMGIFLSGYDVWLHNHFFPQAWQVALVVEPHSKQGGLFVRKNGELDARKYAGFYELRNRRVESVVDWKNLHLEKLDEPKVDPPKAEQPKAQPSAAPPAATPEAAPNSAAPQSGAGEETEPLNKLAGQIKVTEAQPKKEIKVTEAKQ